MQKIVLSPPWHSFWLLVPDHVLRIMSQLFYILEIEMPWKITCHKKDHRNGHRNKKLVIETKNWSIFFFKSVVSANSSSDRKKNAFCGKFVIQFDRSEDKVLLTNTKGDLKVTLLLFFKYLSRIYFSEFSLDMIWL